MKSNITSALLSSCLRESVWTTIRMSVMTDVPDKVGVFRCPIWPLESLRFFLPTLHRSLSFWPPTPPPKTICVSHWRDMREQKNTSSWLQFPRGPIISDGSTSRTRFSASSSCVGNTLEPLQESKDSPGGEDGQDNGWVSKICWTHNHQTE